MAQEELEKKEKEKAEAREKARKAVQRLTITSADVEHGVKKIKILQTAKEESGSFLRDGEDSKRGNAARRRTPHRSHRTGADQDNRKNEEMEARTQPDETPPEAQTVTQQQNEMEETPLVVWKSKGQKTERKLHSSTGGLYHKKKRSTTRSRQAQGCGASGAMTGGAHETENATSAEEREH